MPALSNPPIEAVAPRAIATSTAAAAGADLAGATALSPGIVLVTASNGSKGVRIPLNSKGKRFVILNSVSGQNLLVYPPSASGTLNFGSGGDALTVAGRKSCEIVMYSDLAGYSNPLLPS